MQIFNLIEMKRFFNWILIFSGCFFLVSWGGTGHRIISNKASLSFNEEMQLFQSWGSYLAEHASDADYRKSDDPNESPKHYIDIDHYAEFVNSGYIPQTIGEAISAHGYTNVYDWGILPWATKTTYDSLKSNLEKNNWEKAKYFAADLGHYVADGHMPLHITLNYNGQETNNDGIHSRYESTMINAHSSELTYSGESIEQITDVTQYILDYIAYNNKYVDSVLIADNYAKSINSSYSSTEYKNALWEKTGAFTITLFKNASHALAELIYTAWIEAGRPSLTGVDLVSDTQQDITLYPIAPNPFHGNTSITFTLNKPNTINLAVYDITGKLVTTLASGELTNGNYTVEWIPSNQSPGLYFIALNSNSRRLTQKIILK